MESSFPAHAKEKDSFQSKQELDGDGSSRVFSRIFWLLFPAERYSLTKTVSVGWTRSMFLASVMLISQLKEEGGLEATISQSKIDFRERNRAQELKLWEREGGLVGFYISGGGKLIILSFF